MFCVIVCAELCMYVTYVCIDHVKIAKLNSQSHNRAKPITLFDFVEKKNYIFLAMNYKNCCRTCLGNEKEMRQINSSIVISGENIKLLDILENFYRFKVTDDPSYPDIICINCVHQLTITYSFKVLIESSQNTISEDTNQPNSASEIDQYESDIEMPKQKVRFKKRQNIKSENRTQELKVLFCVECKAEFNSIQTLNDHCRENHPVKCAVGRDCTYCHEKFEDFRSLVLHRKLHQKPLLCEHCWDGFYTDDELNAHKCKPSIYKEKDKSQRVLRQCDQCGKSYPPGYIRVHMRTHSSDRPYSCKFCPKKFKVLGGLHSHILWNHKRTRNHKCEVCNATFISSSSRSSHIRKNHLKEKKYGCDSCGKRFFSKSELQRHSLTHTGVKNFHCHLCDKSYQTRYGLNVHLKTHAMMPMNVLNL